MPDNFDWAFFQWNKKESTTKVEFQDGPIGYPFESQTTVRVRDGTGFKTVIGDVPLVAGGKYFFKVKINNGSLIKIGVCRKSVNIEQAFCDTEEGWALYNGELRHGSNSGGQKYGCPIKSNDVVAVLLDTVEGTLSYRINGNDQGVAFKDEELKHGEFFPALSPIYAGDSFTLITPCPED